MVWRAEKIWRKPKVAKILIYDRCGAEVLLGYVRKEDAEIMDVRGESINLYVLLKCILAFDLSGECYRNKYIAAVRPAVILTFIDNNPRFYELKRANPQAVTVFLQNGWRGETADVFGYLKQRPRDGNYRVDYMLTFGSAMGEKYREYIAGRVMPIGSIRCNQVLVSECADSRSLVFISQYGVPLEDPDQAEFVSIDGRPVTWRDFYSAEKTVVGFLARYCENRGLSLQICGRDPGGTAEEYEFFRETIGNRKWQYLPRDGHEGNYKLVDRATVVVGIDSTLVYESLARGKKTGVFSIRSDLLRDPAAKFGWPETLPDNGPFWTNQADENAFEKILDYLITVSDADWEKIRKEYVPNLIEYDPGNSRFTSLLQALHIQPNDRYISHVQ